MKREKWKMKNEKWKMKNEKRKGKSEKWKTTEPQPYVIAMSRGRPERGSEETIFNKKL